MSAFRFTLITPTGRIFDDEVNALVAPGQEGLFGVLAQHAPMVALLKQGILLLRQNERALHFTVDSGILEVKPNHEVILLSNTAAPVP